MFIDTILSQLSEHLQCEPLKLDNNGVCRLVFDETLVVDIENVSSQNEAQLFSVIKQQADELESSALVAILEANLTDMSNTESYFAIDQKTNELVLMSNISLNNTDFTGFVDKLDVFVNILEKWSNKVNSGLVFTGTQKNNDQALTEFDQHGGLRL